MNPKKRVLLVIQYFFPSPGITSKLYLDLARVLVENGFDVTVFTSNRCHVSENEISPLEEEKDGIHITRFSIPRIKTKIISRFIQSFYLQKEIRLHFRTTNKHFDFAIVGSHPVFSYLMFHFFKKQQKDMKILYWCFDLFPDGFIIGKKRVGNVFLLFRSVITRALNNADIVADLGICMRKRLQVYTSAKNVTLTPWAFVEENTLNIISQSEKEAVFNKHKFFFLFSGSVTYGRKLNVFIDFVRYCKERDLDVALCIAGFGHFAARMKKEYHDCTDYILFMDYCDEAELRKRLSAADVHLLSLEDQATGCAVPSKFFAALAVGRPVVAAVSPESCIAHWIEQYKIGTVLRENNFESSFLFIKKLYDDRDYALSVQNNALSAYKKDFSRHVVTTRMVKIINDSIEQQQTPLL